MQSNYFTNSRPLANLDEWENDLLRRYPEPTTVAATSFRNYAAEVRPSVKEFYRLNHQHQTHDFVKRKREQYLSLNKRRMSIWDAMEYLNTLIDDSDPDIDLPQIEHLLQTAEAIRKAGRPRWYILTGLIHDLGKILCLWDEPQWAVVGDTFPVGCRYSEKIVFYEAFSANEDFCNVRYQTELGIYESGCGLDKVMLSWGHDEYLYHVVKDYLPLPSLYMIRYHSCYPIHRENAYEVLMDERDREMFVWVNDFNQYDLYTKRDERMDVAALRPFYEALIAEYFPNQINW
ncbi:MAG TPA: inositol oxygenase family protein [Pirellula sp.]|nr:inositol oxygenase family protein [Pirellula sp.]